MFKLLLSTAALANYSVSVPLFGQVTFPNLKESDFNAIVKWFKSVADDDCTDVKKGAKQVFKTINDNVKNKAWGQIKQTFQGVSPMAPMVLDMAKDPILDFLKKAMNDFADNKLCSWMRAFSRDTKKEIMARAERIMDMLKDSKHCPMLRKEATSVVHDIAKHWGGVSRESVRMITGFSSNPKLHEKAVEAHKMMEEAAVLGGEEIVSNHLCRLAYQNKYESKHDRHHEEL